MRPPGVQDLYCDEVLSGKLEVRKVVETERVLAFHHTRPFFTLAHVVVIPKEHVPSILEIDDALLREVFDVVRQVARTVLAEHGAAQITTNVGSYQHNKHLHVHVGAGERQQSVPLPR